MNAAACSWRTSIMRMPSFTQEDSARSIGPPMMKNKSSTPSFLRHFARISEPVNSAIGCFLPDVWRCSDRVVLLQPGHLIRAEPQPFAEHFRIVLAEERRGSERRGTAAEAHGPRGHLVVAAGRMPHRLQDTAS